MLSNLYLYHATEAEGGVGEMQAMWPKEGEDERGLPGLWNPGVAIA